MSAGPAPSHVDERIILQSLEAWSRGDIEAFLDYLTEDVYWDDPPMPSPATDKLPCAGGPRRRLALFLLSSFICIISIAGRSTASLRIGLRQQRMTGSFDPPGYAPTGRHIKFDGIDLIEVRDGKICRVQTFIDGMKTSMKVGFMPPRPRPGRFAERMSVRVQRAIAWFQRRERKASGSR